MAYRFNSTTDLVEFALGPFNGHTFGPLTMAVFLQRGFGTGGTLYLLNFTDSALTSKLLNRIISTDQSQLRSAVANGTGPQTITGTSAWYLLVVTRSASGSIPRFHVHDGTSWNHADAPSGVPGAVSIGATDRLTIHRFSDKQLDYVCAGIKKADSSDATVETLSRTAFSAWLSFGFDWLIGFDSSLVSGGLLQDQASPGTGDESSRVGTTLVTDPPGWSFATAATPVANFSATPLSGTAPLSVAFSDSSTNTPTSWAWDFGDGGTSSSQNPTHSYTIGGVYTVSLTATNAAGSDGETKTAYVTVAETIAYAAGGGIEIY